MLRESRLGSILKKHLLQRHLWHLTRYSQVGVLSDCSEQVRTFREREPGALNSGVERNQRNLIPLARLALLPELRLQKQR